VFYMPAAAAWRHAWQSVHLPDLPPAWQACQAAVPARLSDGPGRPAPCVQERWTRGAPKTQCCAARSTASS